MREKDKMFAGEIYDANYDKELIEEIGNLTRVIYHTKKLLNLLFQQLF